MNHLFKNLIFAVFGIITLVLFIFFFKYPPTTSGGDILEYFGMTESIIKDGAISLTPSARYNLGKSLNPGYFANQNTDQNGGLLYYMEGKNGNLYPVHFFFYSVLAMPARYLLKLFHLNELNTLRFTNLIIFSLAAFFIMKNFLTTNFKRIVFLLAFYLSPLVWFIIWPGPDILYTSLLLISVFLFFKERYILASLVTAVASWHSQPIIIVSLGYLIYYLTTQIKFAEVNTETGERHFVIPPLIIPTSLAVIALIAIPYLYNLLIFGVLTPWTILKDGWTQINGFGFQNAGFGKLFEQFFDLNMGLFFYAPVILILGFYFLFKNIKDKKIIALLAIIIITAFSFQTNPAWNYGTSGYGPSRHILFLVPFLIFLIVKYIKPIPTHFFALGVLTAGQLTVMSLNGFLTPDFSNSLNNSPYAKLILNRAPRLYSPTPEIFVDRTNHTDLKFPSSAFYKVKGECKKAYVLKTDAEKLKKECGKIPKGYEFKLTNDLARKANFPRTTKTIEGTFWPDPGSCGKDYVPSKEKPFVCMHTKEDFAKQTGLTDLSRVRQVDNFDGVWRVDRGDVEEITVPPGYIFQDYSFEGTYVNF